MKIIVGNDCKKVISLHYVRECCENMLKNVHFE